MMTIVRNDHTTRGPGVYLIRNNITNKIYIGATANVYERFQTHRYYLKNNIHTNPHIQNDYHTYGLSSFEFIVAAEFSEVRDAKECEKQIIKNFDYKNLLYNVHYSGNTLSYKKSAQHRAKLSASQKGNKHSEESKAKMSAAAKGKTKSEETKARMSAAAKERMRKRKEDLAFCSGL